MRDSGHPYDSEIDAAIASLLQLPWEPIEPEALESTCDWLNSVELSKVGLWARNTAQAQPPSVVRRLVQRSFSLRQQDPQESLQVARYAVEASKALRYPAEFSALAQDLRAEALGNLANCLRLVDEFALAEEAWSVCEETRLHGTHDITLEASLADKRASLLKDQKRYEEALKLQEISAGLFFESGESHRAGVVRLGQAVTHFDAHEPAQALDAAALAGKLIDPRKEPEMGFALMHNTLFFLEAYKLPNAALSLFNRLRPMYGDMDSPLINTRALWLSGRLFFAVGRHKPAAKYFDAARKAFLDHGLAYDAALAGFDSARAWAHLGDTLRVQLIADRMYEVFTDKNIPSEAAKALELFVEAAQRAQADVALMTRLAEQLAKAPRP